MSHYLKTPPGKWPHNICQSQGFIYLCSSELFLSCFVKISGLNFISLINWLIGQFEQREGKV